MGLNFPQVKPLEEFQGFVETIEGDVAHVRLDSQRGERLCGPYPAHELIALGIKERDRFLLKAIDLGGDVRIEITPIPRVKITAERQRQIREEIGQSLGDFDPSFEGMTVLETFDGFVDRIEGDTVFVTLQSRTNGDVD